MANATDRNDKLANPGSDALKIVAFFEEMQKLMTGEEDKYVDAKNTEIARKWNYGVGSGYLEMGKMSSQIMRLEGEVTNLQKQLQQTTKTKPNP